MTLSGTSPLIKNKNNGVITKTIDITDFLILSLSLFLFYGRSLDGRVLANDPGDLGSIPSFVILKTLKMVLDNPFLNT